MAARYQHLSPAFLAEAVARLDSAYGLATVQETPAKQLPPPQPEQQTEARA